MSDDERRKVFEAYWNLGEIALFRTVPLKSNLNIATCGKADKAHGKIIIAHSFLRARIRVIKKFFQEPLIYQ